MAQDNQDNPPTGGVTPYLMVSDAGGAADFYKKAFGAEERVRHPADDGERFLHIHLHVNGSSVMLSDPFPEYGHVGQTPAAFTLHLQVDDADAWFERAVAAGAAVAMPIGDQFWGDRYGQVRDPYGVIWSIGAPLKKA